MPRGGRVMGSISQHTKDCLAELRKFLNPNRPVSVRTCYYRLITVGLVKFVSGRDPGKEAMRLSRKVQRLCTEARVRDANGEANGLDDECFEDNRRRVVHYRTWENLSEYTAGIASRYWLDRWQNQKNYVECWLEKDTTSSLVADVCEKYFIDLRVSSGSFSRPFLIRAAASIHLAAVNKKRIHIFFVGDFDPKGIDIERAAREGNHKTGARRSEGLFEILQSKYNWTLEQCKRIHWTRIAVTERDFLSLPDNLKVSVKQAGFDEVTGKETKGDALAPAYVAKYGDLCAEVEAVEVQDPGIVGRRLTRAILKWIDRKAWAKSEKQEESDRKRLRAMK